MEGMLSPSHVTNQDGEVPGRLRARLGDREGVSGVTQKPVFSRTAHSPPGPHLTHQHLNGHPGPSVPHGHEQPAPNSTSPPPEMHSSRHLQASPKPA